MNPRTRQVATALEQIRERRTRVSARRSAPANQRTVAPDVEKMMREMNRERRSIAVVSRAWPLVIRRESLVNATTLRVARGVLTVYVPSAAVRFELDRLLRAGGETELMRALPAAVNVKRIVLKVGQPPVEAEVARQRAEVEDEE